MPSSPGSPARRPSGSASRDRLAAWESQAFTALRRQRDATTPTDDELPDDPLANEEATRSALDRLGRA